jgi:hypothetical protein
MKVMCSINQKLKESPLNQGSKKIPNLLMEEGRLSRLPDLHQQRNVLQVRVERVVRWKTSQLGIRTSIIKLVRQRNITDYSNYLSLLHLT